VQQLGRDVGRRMVVERGRIAVESLCSQIEVNSNRSCNHRPTPHHRHRRTHEALTMSWYTDTGRWSRHVDVTDQRCKWRRRRRRRLCPRRISRQLSAEMTADRARPAPGPPGSRRTVRNGPAIDWLSAPNSWKWRARDWSRRFDYYHSSLTSDSASSAVVMVRRFVSN